MLAIVHGNNIAANLKLSILLFWYNGWPQFDCSSKWHWRHVLCAVKFHRLLL